jgi:hypothetical protein
MGVEVTQDTEYECWNYRIRYPGGGSLGGSGYVSELWAWRAAALHLATLVQVQRTPMRYEDVRVASIREQAKISTSVAYAEDVGYLLRLLGAA